MARNSAMNGNKTYQLGAIVAHPSWAIGRIIRRLARGCPFSSELIRFVISPALHVQIGNWCYFVLQFFGVRVDPTGFTHIA